MIKTNQPEINQYAIHSPKFVMGGIAGGMRELRYQASDTSATLRTQSFDIIIAAVQGCECRTNERA